MKNVWVVFGFNVFYEHLSSCFVLSGDRQVIPRPRLGQVSHGRYWGVRSKVSTSLISSTLLLTKVHFNNKFKIIIIGYFSSLFKHDSTQKDTGYTWVSLFRFRLYAQCWCASIPQVQKGYGFLSCIPTTPNSIDCLSWVKVWIGMCRQILCVPIPKWQVVGLTVLSKETVRSRRR